MEMFIVHYQTNVLYILQLGIKKNYKCQLEYLFWVMGIMFYEIQRPSWPVAIRDRIRRSFSGNGRGFYFPNLNMSWMQEDAKHWGYGDRQRRYKLVSDHIKQNKKDRKKRNKYKINAIWLLKLNECWITHYRLYK